MKKYLYIVLLFLTSCSNNENKLVVVFDEASSISEGNRVFLKGQEIGVIKNVGLNSKYEVCATVNLIDDIKLPKDSKFRITNFSLFENGIEVVLGISKQMLSNNDSVRGTFGETLNFEDVLDDVTKAIDNSKPVKNQDSLITELHKLNEELEKLNGK